MTTAAQAASGGPQDLSTPRVVVLGGGPAGDVAALRGAQLGAHVTLIERAELGGTCLNWGCIPTKSLLAGADLLRKIRTAGDFGIEVPEVRIDFGRMMERKEEIVRGMRSGVEGACARKQVRVVREQGVVDGDAVVCGEQRHPFDHLIVCVGTEPAGMPGVDMDHPCVVTSNGVLRLERIPERLLIVGGGVIGCEFASLFAPLGSRITVVELLPEILAGVDSRVTKQFRKLMERQGIEFRTGVRLERVEEYRADELRVALSDGATLNCDTMLVSIGRIPQTRGIGLEDVGVGIDERNFIAVDPMLHTGNPRIWAAGDCIGGQQLAHLASAEAERAVENALGHDARAMDRTVVPSCIYTHPEIAMVGYNTDTAKMAGIDVKVGQARLLGNGKALGEGEPDGMAQLYTERSTDMIVGATIMGSHAVEMIHEVGVAISDGMTGMELGEIIHAHPTVSEIVMDAADQGEGVAPYLS